MELIKPDIKIDFLKYRGMALVLSGLLLLGAGLGYLAAAIAGKFGGCTLAARLSGFSMRESTCIGVMMNTRALMELVVINVGYDLGVIPASVFTMLVIMAVVSTLVTAPALRLWLPRLILKPVLEAS